MKNKDIAQSFNEVYRDLDGSAHKNKKRIGVTLVGSEVSETEILEGALIAHQNYPELEIVLIGGKAPKNQSIEHHEAGSLEDCHRVMIDLLEKKSIDACLTLHYNFPFGVTTISKAITPAYGKEIIIASNTGSTDINRNIAMIKNAIYGQAFAKSLNIASPTVGVLNVDGANTVVTALKELKNNGYPLNFGSSNRGDATITMRGNDVVQGTCEVLVTDTLTGNILIKMLGAFCSGGFEASGYGYGSAIGEGYPHIIGIMSRATGKYVISRALYQLCQSAQGNLIQKIAQEIALAKKAGLDTILGKLSSPKTKTSENSTSEAVPTPPKKVVSQEILGIDILEIENVKILLWKNNFYAEVGMGCTGPAILVNKEDLATVKDFLIQHKVIS